MSMKTWTQFTRTLPKKINLNEVQNQSEANCIVLLISNHFSNSKIKEFHQYIYNQFNGKSLIGAVVDSVGAPGYSLTACHGIGFYSKPGRIQKQKAVGRWPSMFNQPMVDNPIFKTISLKAQNVNQDVLPNNSLSSNPSLLLTFSDNEPYDLYDHFQSQYPDSIKMGLVASRTPFLNGNPYTLFYNDQTISNGCVGLSTTDKVNFSYNDSIFQPLHDDYLTISKSQGNIILQIEGSDASRLLVEKVSTQIQPHSDFNLYIRIKSQTNQEMIFSIIGGDLSKGTLAIETLSDLTPGMKIQFMKYQGSPIETKDEKRMVEFTTVKDSYEKDVQFTETELNKSSMIASSEEGVLMGSNSILGGYQLSSINLFKGTVQSN